MNIEQPLAESLAEKVTVKAPERGDLENWFTYHPPTDETIPKYKLVRDSALVFARVVHDNCPAGPDRSAAIRKIREAVMTANASIACCGQ